MVSTTHASYDGRLRNRHVIAKIWHSNSSGKTIVVNDVDDESLHRVLNGSISPGTQLLTNGAAAAAAAAADAITGSCRLLRLTKCGATITGGILLNNASVEFVAVDA